MSDNISAAVAKTVFCVSSGIFEAKKCKDFFSGFDRKVFCNLRVQRNTLSGFFFKILLMMQPDLENYRKNVYILREWFLFRNFLRRKVKRPIHDEIMFRRIF